MKYTVFSRAPLKEMGHKGTINLSKEAKGLCINFNIGKELSCNFLTFTEWQIEKKTQKQKKNYLSPEETNQKIIFWTWQWFSHMDRVLG